MALQGVLEKVLAELPLPIEAQLLALSDPRLGHRLVMALTSADESLIRQIIDRFNTEVLPHEKVIDSYTVPHIPRTPLGKVKTKELALLLGRT
jgi:acyl-CoA synthetase (AMP-forming)/AMP-acid ligase II